jgi:hypothetical protein
MMAWAQFVDLIYGPLTCLRPARRPQWKFSTSVSS